MTIRGGDRIAKSRPNAYAQAHEHLARHPLSVHSRMCRFGAQRVCIGCGRKLGEIGGWQKFTNAEKQAIIDELPTRLANSQS